MASGFPGRTPTPRRFLREGLKPNTLLPSKFQREKLLNTKQEASTGESFLPRIGPCVDRSEIRQKLSPAPPKRSVLAVSPRELVFQDFVAHGVSEMVLSIMNKDKISRMVKISMESSPYFQLACPSDVYHIVPPGASAPVRIRFTPGKNKDYSHELTCITAKEKIVVPIRAIGARAVLVFPDQLDFSTCPVKHTTQKTLLVRNAGNQTAHYQLSTQSPFSVVPTAGTLGAGDTMQVTVRFHALTNGDHFGSLAVCSNPDEQSIHTKLHGEAVELDVALSTNSVEADKTFITMVHQTTVFIKNRSNITAHFQWKAFPSEGEENEEKRRQCRLLHPLSEVRLENSMEEKEVEKVQGFSEDHSALLRSRVQEMKAKAHKDPLLFSNDVFSIEPMEGEIGPNCSAAIKVTFEPLEALEYRSVAYCNISGRESRLPLYLRGEGQGPMVELSSPTLNLGKIFIDTPYVYEVKLINQGALDAPFTYIPSTTNVDFCFKIEPERGLIAPGGTQTVQISFHTTTELGWFEEEFQFSVDGSPTPVILTIKGSVTGPDLHFDLPELNFRDISFGFPCTKSIRLTNGSMVPVTFELRVSNDGTQPAVSSFDQIRKEGDPSWSNGIHFYVEPREFTMNPSQGTILPQGHQDIEVTLCSNTVMDFRRKLLVDLEGFGEEVASVVIRARCVVPELTVSPIVLSYHECLLKVPYERKLVVVNSTGLPGCYGLILQQPEEDSPVLYSSPKPCGIVEPYSTAEIPVIIEVQTVGEHRTKVLVGVFGDETNPRRVELRSTGHLGEIYPSPSLLEFGRIPALQPTSQSFTLFNKGLVPTDFRVEMASKSYCFVIEPSEGVIPARGEVPVTITATLDDTVAFDDTVQLFIRNSLWTTVLLQAFGIGTTIVIDKPFAPELNLGYQFSLVPCFHQFKVTNKGRRYHQLFWGVECYSPPEEGGQSVSTLSSLKAKDDSQKPKRASPAFGVKSPTMGLQRGQSEDMVLRGFSRIPQEVQDYVFCDALIGTSLDMERIIETVITCKFIHPSIEVSAREFSFYVEKKPSDVLTLQYQPLSLKNTCLLPLDLMLDLEQPFLVCDKELQPLPGGQPVRVDVGETCHLYIAFDPAYELDFKSWKKEKVLKIRMVRGHPFVERITLQGEVHFPNLQMQPSSLEFGCIGPGTETVRSLEMTNCSPLPVQYRWSFQSDSEVTRFRDGLCPLKFKPQPPKGKNTSLGSPASRWRHFKMRQEEEAARMLKEVDNFTQSLRDKVQAAQLPEYPRLRVGFEGVSVSTDEPQTPLQAEEAFSIVPVSGVLQPGESQQVSFTFSGDLNTIFDVTALCHVEGGPTYEVLVTGEVSRLSYQEINCGSQVFNEIHHSNVTLVNGGTTDFDWLLNPSPADQHLPGVFLVNSTTGSLAPGKKQVLKFSYMPGLPGAFSRTYHLKVGNLEPENICLKGEASFPMISLDLPWNIRGNEKYEKTLLQSPSPALCAVLLLLGAVLVQQGTLWDVSGTAQRLAWLCQQSQLTPSALQKEMSLSTKQRLARAKKLSLPQVVQPQDKPGTSDHKFPAADPEQSPFQPCPPEVIFQSYCPGDVCEVPLVLRNRDTVPHLLKVTLKRSPYFQLVGPSDVCRKVPPGLCKTVRILFTPGQTEDYFHKLLCTTEREEFIVPIRAIGARGFLDLPDQLDFSTCPVKHTTRKTLLVRNVGNHRVHFHLSTQSPFSVVPDVGTLDVGGAVEVAVEFQPLKAGDHSGSLVVHYDKGEKTHTSLHARAVDANIGLDRNTVTLENTYITMSNSTTVLIHNLSDITARFQWKAVDTEEEEDQLRRRQYHMIHEQQRQRLYGFLKQSEVDIPCRERLSLLNHAFQSEVANIGEDPVLLDDDSFSLKPKEGEISPNCSAEISVFFAPQAAQLHERTVYCDISGRENRLPLLLRGEGLGPQVHFHFEELNIGKVFVRVTNRYEAYLINDGPIEAPFKLIPPTTDMGSCFTLLPQEGIVAPDKLQVIQVSFCPTIRGEFEEEFCFHVTDSPKPVTFTVRGSVMGPTFHFDVPALDFGEMAFGFPRTLKCCLFNTSLIPMGFSLHIPGDGSGVPSVDSSTQTTKPSSQSWRKRIRVLYKPREFTINPQSGTVRALGSQDIKVTLCPNTVGEYKLELVLDVEDIGKKVFALPLTARCIVPSLRLLNPVLNLGYCCLKVIYREKVTLVNDCNFPGCYCVLPQEHREEAAAWYSSPAPSGIIEPHSSLEIPITLEAQLLGQCNITAKLAVFGRPGSLLEIHLQCFGQGPVVYVHPREINFGSIPVLEDCSETLYLANQCEIPAAFQVEMAGKRSCWRTEPSKGVVPPNSEVSVAVIANLNDTVKFQEEVKVFIENNAVTIISLQAVGNGTTIVTDKPLVPKLDLKSCFSFSCCFYHFQLTNRGRRIQRLSWSTEGFRTSRRSSQAPAPGATKDKGAPLMPRPGSPVFKLSPVQVDLRPGQTVDMLLEGCSSTVQEVQERLLCHAVVGKETSKKQIMQVDVICNFICPVVQMSSKAVAFRVEKKPSDVLTLQYQPLSLKNTCLLPLDLMLDLKQPFLVCDKELQPLPGGQPVRVDVGETCHLYIAFDPAYKNSMISWVVKKVLRVSFMEHPRVVKIPVRGEVYFPNLHLPIKAMDFGCIINDTQQELHMEMINCSPLPVNYHWSFLIDSQVNTIRFIPSPPKFKPPSSKKKRVFPWRYSRTESVEEPTETPETTQDSALEDSALEDSALEDSEEEDPAQEEPALEDPAQEEPALEDPAQEEPALEDPAQEEPALEDPAQEDPAQEDSDQEPADAEHSLETKMLSSTPGASQRPLRMRRLSWFSEMEHPKLGVQEVFDVRPLWGELQPGETEQVTFGFFGHANIVARVTALCHVQGGPTYEVVLTGEASCPSYQLDVEEIDWGLQVLNKVLKAQVTLRNTGVMEFSYVVPNCSTGTAANPLPGVPMVVPTTGFLAPGQKQVFKVYYLPGKLGAFRRTFQIEVAHLEPAEIILKGKGTFPGVTKYRPRMLTEDEEILQEEEKNPEEEEKEKDESSVAICGDGVTDGVTVCQS